MKSALLDVNVLLALAWPNHQHHEAAQRWFQEEASGGWATCALTQLAFIRLSSNPAFTPAAVSPGDAAGLLSRMIARPEHRFWAEVSPARPALFDRARGHRQVTDAYLVGLAALRRGRLVTFDTALRAHASDPTTVHVLAP